MRINILRKALKINSGALLIATSSLLLANYGYAQSLPAQLPGSADPARINQRMQQDTLNKEQKIIGITPDETSQDIPNASNGFILKDIKIVGMSVFTQNELQPLLDKYINKEADLNVLNHLAKRITALYRQEGYFISRAIIPEQEVTEDGAITIQVIEGRVNNVIIDDPENLLSSDRLGTVEKTAEYIEKSAPLHGPTIERYLLQLNDSSGIFVQSLLSAPDDENAKPGSVDMLLKVQSTPAQVLVSYDNHGSRFVGPHQFGALWSGGNLLTTMDSASIQIGSTIPMSEVTFVSALYTLPLSASGLNAFSRFSYSNSEPGYTLEALEVESDSTSAEVGMSYPLVRNRGTSLDISGSLNMQNSATEFLDEELIDDKVRYIKTALNYQEKDLNLDLELRKGLDIFSATKTGSDNLSRNQGRSDFFSAQAGVEHTKDIGKSFALESKADAQFAPHPLLSSQEFGYGGVNYGRAYDPSEITGDSGMRVALEAQYRGVENLKITKKPLSLTPFAFYDIGKVWNQEQNIKPQSAASTGFGLHYNYNNQLYGTVQAAWALTKDVATPIMNNQNSPRILFSVSSYF